MESLCIQLHAIAEFLTMEKITGFSVVIAIILGIYNIIMLRNENKNKEDTLLFNIAIGNLNCAIKILESLPNDKANDSYTWYVTAEQLSAFHNIAIQINNFYLRQCYCAKLHSFILRIDNILDKIDDYRFYYGVKDYKNINASDLIKESNLHHNNISANALHCIMQFISLFYGSRGDYMFNEIELEKILRPVYYGIGKDTDRTPEEIERLPLKFKNIYRYINEWCEEIKNMRK
jgi:hypothetical protein